MRIGDELGSLEDLSIALLPYIASDHADDPVMRWHADFSLLRTYLCRGESVRVELSNINTVTEITETLRPIESKLQSRGHVLGALRQDVIRELPSHARHLYEEPTPERT